VACSLQKIGAIEPGGAHPHSHAVSNGRRRIFHVLQGDALNAAEFLDHDCAHDFTFGRMAGRRN
jgi:hypothetical protein